MLIIFDFDGTIADTTNSFLEIANEILTDFGRKPLSEGDFTRIRGMQPRAALRAFKIPMYRLPAFARLSRNKAMERLDEVQLIEGVRHEIAILSQQNTLGILTSNDDELVRRVLKKHELLEYFDFVKSAKGVFGKHKGLKSICRQHGIDPADALYIGDEIRDIEACKKIKMPIISVTWGFNLEDSLAEMNPDYIVRKPSQLTDIISTLQSR